MENNLIDCGNCRTPTKVNIFGQPPDAAMMKAIRISGWFCDGCSEIKAEWHRAHDYDNLLEEPEL